jgi:glycolate oxidase FAD binding subunit
MRGSSVVAQRVAPESVEELARVLAHASGEDAAVVLEGGSTLHGMGNRPERSDVAVSLLRLNQLLAHEFHDLTCSVRAGMTLSEFSDCLSRHGQFVPIDAPLRKQATIGGTMSAGWLGPRRHYYGRPRDFAIGTQVVLADGTIANAGGMVVKNVSGYDMSKLYVGSFGTLAAIAQVNFKTLPVPQRSRALIAALPENTRSRAMAQLTSLPVTPAAACCIEGFRKEIDGDDGVDGRLIVLLEGSQGLLDRATRDVRSALGRAGVPGTVIVDEGAQRVLERLLDAEIAAAGERSMTYRSLCAPAEVQQRAPALRDAANRCELFTDVLLDVMNGDVYLRVTDRDSRAFAEKIEACDDAIRGIDPKSIVVSGNAPIRSSISAWGELPSGIEKMRAMKAAFDPKRTLNPGRFIGGI